MKASSIFSHSHLYLLFLLPFILLLLHSPPAIGNPLLQNCGQSNNYTANSSYQTNLNTLLTILVSNTTTSSGFSNVTVGQIPEQVYGMAMCSGDVNATTCLSCLQDASRDTPQTCPYDKSAYGVYENCRLRYSNQYFFSSFDNSPYVLSWNANNATDVPRFNQLMNSLMNATTNYAANNSTKKNFATGEIGNYSSDSPTIYGLTQCTPDMPASQCTQCLHSLLDGIPTNQLNGKQGGLMAGFRCNFRYEVFKFYEETPTISLTAAAIAPAPAPASDPSVVVSPPTPVEIPSATGSSGNFDINHDSKVHRKFYNH